MIKVTQSEEETARGVGFLVLGHIPSLYIALHFLLMSSSSVFKDYNIIPSLLCMKRALYVT